MFHIMLRDHRVDDIWMQGRMCYHQALAGLLSAWQQYKISKKANVPVTKLLHGITKTWRKLCIFAPPHPGTRPLSPNRKHRAPFGNSSPRSSTLR